MTKKRTNLIRQRILLLFISAVFLIFTTFGWFIGMQTVGVSSFDIEIAGNESLLLSFDGNKWSNSITISKDILDQVSYEGHTNWWAGRGLSPVSSVGKIDPVSSRLIMYEKGSLATSAGGYRLMASQVPNDQDEERSGYVAFDLFIKNITGTNYIEPYNILDEEDIYLTVDSEVTVALAGGVADTGIENSVRVAFAQIGRVHETVTDVAKITGITCLFDEEGKQTVVNGVTGICRDATIWEPNDTKHVQNAINWYNINCNKRIGSDLNNPSSYSGACNTVENGVAYPTYAVKEEIIQSDRVDIYDGAAYNGYALSPKLEAVAYFTDTDKLKAGIERPTFMKLAPSSITKVRVYVYLEGQDIDNYDFASIGRKISVNFGFTKNRFEGTDINYDGPDYNILTDTIPPVITLVGSELVTVSLGNPYTDQGATAQDNIEGDITGNIVINNPVNTEVLGTYITTYNVKDFAGNPAEEVTRTVIVE